MKTHIWYFVIYRLFIKQPCIDFFTKRYGSLHRTICWAKYVLFTWWIFIDEWIIIDKLKAKTCIKILYSNYKSLMLYGNYSRLGPTNLDRFFDKLQPFSQPYNARQTSSVMWCRITRQLMRGHCEPDPESNIRCFAYAHHESNLLDSGVKW